MMGDNRLGLSGLSGCGRECRVSWLYGRQLVNNALVNMYVAADVTDLLRLYIASDAIAYSTLYSIR